MKPTAQRQLQNLTDALVEDIISMSAEEIIEEARENGMDIEADVEKFREMLESIVTKRQ